jgi:hypothetical protein
MVNIQASRKGGKSRSMAKLNAAALARRPECGEVFDRADLDAVFFHSFGHKPRPDIPYSGSKPVDPDPPAEEPQDRRD